MDFKKALEFKNTFGEIYTQDNIQYKVFVVPKKEVDLNEYLASYSYNSGYFTDKTAIEFSSNSEFEVYALTINNTFVLRKRLSF